ncbi:MAG: glutamine synthetase [Chloroflexi bacterium]|nr:glutamine synthetase [Chloroflexota bacterium]
MVHITSSEATPPVSSSDDEAKEFVLRSANQQDVRFVRLWFTDIVGTVKGFAITIDELEHVLNSGASFDGAVIDGLARSDEADTVAVPDPTTWQILPWRPSQDAVASMFCDLSTPDREPLQTDGRHILRNVMQRARSLGYNFYVAPELEFFYVDDVAEYRTFSREYSSPNVVESFNAAKLPNRFNQASRYFDQTSPDLGGAELRRDVVLALEKMGIPVKHSHHEVGHGQHEIDLRHTNALTMADSVVTYRVVVKELAARKGGHATFMPQPFSDRPGSGMHTHMSLFSGDENAFYEGEDDEFHLSEIGKKFIAGLVRHAPEITAITNQWVNSYKRLVPGSEAPIFATWTAGNMNDLIRVPAYRPGQEASMRVEYRAPDAACNPYLAFTALLAAGLEGIEKDYPVSSPIVEESNGASATLPRLPSSLYEAVSIAENSDLLRKNIGDKAIDSFCRNKNLEWDEFNRTVTDFETNRYLDIL